MGGEKAMSQSKRVLMVGGEAGSGELDEKLASQGFDIRRSDPATAANLWAATRSDVVILDLLAATAAGEKDVFLSLAQRLQRSGLSAHRPVIALADLENEESLDATVDHVDDVLYSPLSASELVSRIDALHRLTTMQTELTRRIATAGRFGLNLEEIVPETDSNDSNLLVVGGQQTFAELSSALSGHAVLVCAENTNTATTYLARRKFDAVVSTLPAADSMEFAKQVRRDPAFANIPLIVFGERRETEKSEELYDAGITEILTVGFPAGILSTRVQALVREYRFRERMSAVYRNELRQATCDALTGLYSRGFVMEHLQSLVDDAERWSDSLSIATVKIANIAAINAQHGYACGDLVIRQVGGIIGQLVRGEDLVARWDGTCFAVVFVATEKKAATRAIARLQAIVSASRFASAEIDEPISAELSVGCAEFKSGDTPESLVARALDEIRV